jgi:metal-responsive CopG/Arc/MetJ family transcriptional regulator
LTALANLHFKLPSEQLADLDRVARERHVRRSALLREAVEMYLTNTSGAHIETELAGYVEVPGSCERISGRTLAKCRTASVGSPLYPASSKA